MEPSQYFCRIVISRQSYDVLIEIHNGDGKIYSNKLDLKNAYFRPTYYVPPPPPGMHNTSPSKNICWAAMDVNEMVNEL
jgi:hypothetical protein